MSLYIVYHNDIQWHSWCFLLMLMVMIDPSSSVPTPHGSMLFNQLTRLLCSWPQAIRSFSDAWPFKTINKQLVLGFPMLSQRMDRVIMWCVSADLVVPISWFAEPPLVIHRSHSWQVSRMQRHPMLSKEGLLQRANATNLANLRPFQEAKKKGGTKTWKKYSKEK